MTVTQSRKASPALVVVVGLLVVFAGLFIVIFVVASEPQTAGPEVDAPIAETEVAELLAQADPERGARLVVEHQCVNCHVYAAGMAAPTWNGVADRAARREPPLSSQAYLYESITQPAAFVVEGYSPSMPQNFRDVLTPEETGDIIAYLLTLHVGS
jgi:mono/diheme cytochrome c family protein